MSTGFIGCREGRVGNSQIFCETIYARVAELVLGSNDAVALASDPSDLNLALRELPKAHAQKKERRVIDRASLEARILLIVQ